MALKDLLKKAASTNEGKKKSKSTTPDVNINGADEAIDQWVKGDEMVKEGEALKGVSEAVILPKAEEARVKASKDEGEHKAAVRINGKIMVSTQQRYSVIPASSEARIREVVGDKFEDFFKTKTEVTLKGELLNDEGAMAKIIEAVGEENFTRFFEVKQTLSPTAVFHERRSVDPELSEKFSTLANEGLIKPVKASVKKL